MYDVRPDLLIGFHGCDGKVRDSLLKNPNKIIKSEKPHDWLGHGMYFWENNYNRALEWAQEKKKRGTIKTPAVIGAVVSLDYCLDLMDARFITMLAKYYLLMAENYKILGLKIPENKDLKNDGNRDKILRELDCAVIEFTHEYIRETILKETKNKGFSDFKKFDSVRGVFVEGKPAFPGAGIYDKNHIQICIRNSNCIKGFFLPRKEIDF